MEYLNMSFAETNFSNVISWKPSPQCIETCNNIIENLILEHLVLPFAINFLGIVLFITFKEYPRAIWILILLMSYNFIMVIL